MGRQPGPVRRQRERETVSKGLRCGFHGKESGRRGMGLGLAGQSDVSSCLERLEWESPAEEVDWFVCT